MDEVHYEGEELYDNGDNDENLFEMDRFDPTEDTEEVVSEEKILDSINKKLKEKRKLEDEEKDEPDKKKRKRSARKKNKRDNAPEGFTVLGDSTDSNKKKVTRVLPHWLANPDILEVDLQSEQLAISEMEGLPLNIISRLKREGITHFFPVQRQMIPRLLSLSSLIPSLRPSDLCVSAPTGSGKTLAFVLPIVASLQGRMVPRVRALAVLPTQDLALQVYKVFSAYTEGSGLKVKLLTGGETVVGDMDLVRRGVGGRVHQLYDILVVTPGRLTHTLRACPSLDLSHLRYLVIDEADRMMDNIAQDWLTALETVVYSTNRPKPSPHLTVSSVKFSHHLPLQKLLFSATLSQDPEQLEQLNLFEPKLFRCVVPPKDIVGGRESIGEFTLPSELCQEYVICSSNDRPLMVSSLVKLKKLKSVLVFTHTNDSVHRLAILLEKLGHKTGELHSQIKRRRKLLNQLESGALQILVCSDALARGIDVSCLDGVISYDAPIHLKTYVHRVGRTARAGKAGIAITLCENKQVKNFLKMLKDGHIQGVVKGEISEEDLKDRREVYQESLEQTKLALEEEKLEKKNTKRKFVNNINSSKDS